MVIAIAGSAISYVASYLLTKHPEFAKKTSEAAATKVKGFLDYLRDRWKGDSALKRLEKFEKDPNGYKDRFKETLEEMMEDDKELVEKVRELNDSMKPYMFIRYDIGIIEKDGDVIIDEGDLLKGKEKIEGKADYVGGKLVVHKGNVGYRYQGEKKKTTE